MPTVADRSPAREAIVVLPLLLIAGFGTVLLLVAAGWTPLLRVDDAAVAGLHAFAVDHPLFVLAMKGASRVGSAPFYWVLATALVVWLCVRRRLVDAVFVVVTIGGNGLLNPLVKGLVQRVRPVLADPVAHAGGLSFPSGHSQGALVGYGVLVVILGPLLAARWRRLLVLVAVAIVLTVGFSRVALGVHYPSDVVGGFLLGGAFLAILVAVFRRFGLRGQ